LVGVGRSKKINRTSDPLLSCESKKRGAGRGRKER